MQNYLVFFPLTCELVRLNPADLSGEWSIEGELEQTGVIGMFIRRFLSVKYKKCEMFLLFEAHSCSSCCWGEVCSSPSVSQAVAVRVPY